jgi:hypothetical protein
MQRLNGRDVDVPFCGMPKICAQLLTSACKGVISASMPGIVDIGVVAGFCGKPCAEQQDHRYGHAFHGTILRPPQPAGLIPVGRVRILPSSTHCRDLIQGQSRGYCSWPALPDF